MPDQKRRQAALHGSVLGLTYSKLRQAHFIQYPAYSAYNSMPTGRQCIASHGLARCARIPAFFRSAHHRQPLSALIQISAASRELQRMSLYQSGIAMPATEYYNDKVVRQFLLAAAVWGIVGMSIGVYVGRGADVAGAEFQHLLADLQPHSSRPYLRRDLRLRRLGPDGHLLLRGAAHRPRATGAGPAGRISRSGAGS